MWAEQLKLARQVTVCYSKRSDFCERSGGVQSSTGPLRSTGDCMAERASAHAKIAGSACPSASRR